MMSGIYGTDLNFLPRFQRSLMFIHDILSWGSLRSPQAFKYQPLQPGIVAGHMLRVAGFWAAWCLTHPGSRDQGRDASGTVQDQGRDARGTSNISDRASDGSHFQRSPVRVGGLFSQGSADFAMASPLLVSAPPWAKIPGPLARDYRASSPSWLLAPSVPLIRIRIFQIQIPYGTTFVAPIRFAPRPAFQLSPLLAKRMQRRLALFSFGSLIFR